MLSGAGDGAFIKQQGSDVIERKAKGEGNCKGKVDRSQKIDVARRWFMQNGVSRSSNPRAESRFRGGGQAQGLPGIEEREGESKRRIESTNKREAEGLVSFGFAGSFMNSI